MTWAENLDDLHAASVSLDGFGEPVTLPSGEATGIFYPYPAAPGGALGSEVGLAMMLSRQRSPELHLHDADAVALAKGDQVTARGKDWLISAVPDPDGSGITVIELMPAPTPGGPPDGQSWQ